MTTTERRERSRMARHTRMAYKRTPLVRLPSGDVWYSDERLDRTPKEWLGLIVGSSLFFVGLLAFIFAISFVGTAP